MLIAIDIGNTNIVIGIYKDKILLHNWRLSSTPMRTSDECWILINSLLNSCQIKPSQITGVVLASVVPNITPAFVHAFEYYRNIQPLIVDSELDLELKILYDNPRTVGPDRIVNAMAGYEKFGGPCVIVDFGTTTTFDVVNEKYEYLGGIITPGIEISAHILHKMAARLPKVEIKFPDSIIGRSTETSIQSGLMFGTVELVDGMIRKIQTCFESPIQKIATGGLANLVIPHSEEISIIEPMLTLEGLYILYEKITSRRSFG